MFAKSLVLSTLVVAAVAITDPKKFAPPSAGLYQILSIGKHRGLVSHTKATLFVDQSTRYGGDGQFELVAPTTGLYQIQGIMNSFGEGARPVQIQQNPQAGDPVTVETTGNGTSFGLKRVFTDNRLVKNLKCFQIYVPGTDLAWSAATDAPAENIVHPDVTLATADTKDPEQTFCFSVRREKRVKAGKSRSAAPTETASA